MVRTDERRQWYQIRNAAQDDAIPEILIYDEIDSWFGVAAADLVRELAAIDAPEIIVRINSVGGDVFDGIAILNALRGHPAKITVTVDGLAASIASVIAMGGDEIVMNRNSEMMLHNAWAVCVGNAADMQKTADMLGRMSDNIASIYAERAGGSAQDWLAVMAEETWLSADEAVEAGLADRVIEPEPDAAAAAARAAASFDRSRFRYSGRQAAPAPRIAARAQIPPPVEVEVTEGKEPTVASLKESVLHKLGLDADADEAAIEAAIDTLTERAESPTEQPEPVEATVEDVTRVAAKFGLALVDKGAHDKLVADVQALNTVREQQMREADEHTIRTALTQGRIAAASVDTWRNSLRDNREQTLALLATLPANSIPITEIGYGVGSEDTMDAELSGAFAKITGIEFGKGN